MAIRNLTSRSKFVRRPEGRNHPHARQLERVQDFLAGLETALTMPRTVTPEPAAAAGLHRKRSKVVALRASEDVMVDEFNAAAGEREAFLRSEEDQ
ncbi:MAG TPA: hypothetical protein VMR74_12720 [Gammaproteobacteria bacterium]|nr:hypothetical protein [Gammaproteobacteria bacterium]